MQKKRRINAPLYKLLVSGVSQRRAACILHVHPITIKRRFLFLADQARLKQQVYLKTLYIESKVSFVQFDEMESFEHSKCKPLSIPLAVDEKSRKILGFTVCSMPAKGYLAKIAQIKYGYRIDERTHGMHKLMQNIKPYVNDRARFLSDMKVTYPFFIRRHYPKSCHDVVKGKRGCIVGQGELKKGGYDPLFALNHTAAMIRANVNRLFRRTWCTTKKATHLAGHLWIYMDYHNRALT